MTPVTGPACEFWRAAAKQANTAKARAATNAETNPVEFNLSLDAIEYRNRSQRCTKPSFLKNLDAISVIPLATQNTTMRKRRRRHPNKNWSRGILVAYPN